MDTSLQEQITKAIKSVTTDKVTWTDMFGNKRTAYLLSEHIDGCLSTLDERKRRSIVFDTDDTNSKGIDFEVPSSLTLDYGSTMNIEYIDVDNLDVDTLIVPASVKAILGFDGVKNDRLERLLAKHIIVVEENPYLRSDNDILYTRVTESNKYESIVWASRELTGEVVIKETVNTVRSYAFYESKVQKFILMGRVYCDENAFGNKDIDITVEIHDDEGSVGFCDFDGLTTIILGKDGYIDPEIVIDSNSLSWVEVDSENKWFASKDGVLIWKGDEDTPDKEYVPKQLKK